MVVYEQDICRTKSLKRLIPDLYNYKSVLYIGARTDRMHYGEEFKESNYLIDILEVFAPNVSYLKTISWVEEVHCGDVRTFSTDKKYDIIFWWHGPEHIQEEELASTLTLLEGNAKVAVVLGCPWGNYPQGHLHSNPNEEHVSHYNYQVFEDLGYTVECLGEKDVAGSNITSVKFVK
tara:strand:- start:214 stop:744 length:531 start_codon:yes stop_codon:yes gene_type:complete